MPEFHYTATDLSGAQVRGKINAANEVEVSFFLKKKGFRHAQVASRPFPEPAPTVATANPIVHAPTRVQAPAPVAVPQQSAVPIPVPQLSIQSQLSQLHGGEDLGSLTLGQTHGTGPKPYASLLSKKEVFFLFGQLSSAVKSGVALPIVLERFSQSAHKVVHQSAFRELMGAVSAGTSLGDAMKARPDVFEPHLAGYVSVGETAGRLPNVLDELANSAFEVQKLSKVGNWGAIAMISLAVLAPTTIALQKGAMKAIELQDKAGGTLSPTGTVASSVAPNLGPALLAAAIGVVVLYAALAIWKMGSLRPFRQKIEANTPMLAGRANEEAFSRFSKSLQYLSEAGITPNLAVPLAIGSIPNDFVRERYQRLVGSIREGVPLSAGLMRVLTPTYRDMLEVSELTGDVPGTLQQISRMADDNLERKTKLAGIGLKKTAWAVTIILGAIVAGLLARDWYLGLFNYFANAN